MLYAQKMIFMNVHRVENLKENLRENLREKFVWLIIIQPCIMKNYENNARSKKNFNASNPRSFFLPFALLDASLIKRKPLEFFSPPTYGNEVDLKEERKLINCNGDVKDVNLLPSLFPSSLQ